LASPIDETVTSIRAPGLRKALMSAVTMTAATFFDLRSVRLTVMP